MNSFGQLILFGNNVLKDDVYSREKYIICNSNEQVVEVLSSFSQWKVGKFLILMGGRHSGRTHSCHFFAELHKGLVINHITCDMIYDPEIISTISCVAIDDIEDFEELVLFHIINYLRTRKIFVLLTCRTLTENFQLRDLYSRMVAMPQILLNPPDAFLTQAIFRKMLSDYDINLEDKVTEYIKPRLQLDFVAINNLIDALRDTIFVQKQKMTLAKIKTIL